MNDRQVEFWRGDFGNAYTNRNNLQPALARARVAMWSSILRHTVSSPPTSILEVGANIGINLRALKVLTGARLMALEPNDKARGILLEDEVVAADDVKAGIASKIAWPDAAADLVFTSGVLIHIHPDRLHPSMQEIHRCSARWILSIEYFADSPTEVSYRGNSEVLFKRDFGSEWLELFPSLRPVAYGFEWKRVTGLDNLTWWLFEKP
ncbi:MAG TPA: pseudaminic acid biosynthesis-associated methylase [Xanthobacteraceae bacterium]|jgi:pseudaminic acid biosynthesis-associated methylase|nr:pseudaminic acid biosynthesis-associated methylase [Xanthobacteraceae bacterium]